jgi:hypothetical protein
MKVNFTDLGKMELLSPTRISSLESQTIRVVIHKDARLSEEVVIPNVYPFETIYNLKQRICLAKPDEKTYLPKYLFVAQDLGGGSYATLEYYWPFSKTLPDPYVSPGMPDPRIYEDGSRKGDVFPSILSGITVEDGTSLTASVRVLHVWTAAAIASAAGIRAGTMIADEVFEGYLQLYFPLIRTKADYAKVFEAKDADDAATLTIARTFRVEMDVRLAKVDAGLKAAETTSPLRLRELRNLRYVLPKKEEFETSTLEIKFYEMNPNPAIPFIRFFSMKDASLPLVKLAVGPTGTPIIGNPKILDLMMADIPDTEKSAVILLKAPVNHPQAPPGTAWSMSIYEDGTASLRIGAPRKDAPLTQVAIEAAFEALPGFLEHTVWTHEDKRTLVELTAVYDFKSKLTEKPSRAELRGRLDAFLSFFTEEPLPEKSKASMMLRYRAVSNFDATNDPVMNHLSNLYLRDTKAAAAEVPADEYLNSLVRYFGLSQMEAARAVDVWISTHLEQIRTDKEAVVQKLSMGTAIAIGTNNFPYYTFYLANVMSLKHLQRVLSLLTVFSSTPASVLRVAAAPKAAAAAAAVVAAVKAETPSPEAGAPLSADSEGDSPIGMQQFDFGQDDDDEVDPYNIAAAPIGSAGVAKPNTPTPPPPHLEVGELELPDVLKAGETIGPVSFLSDLKKVDPGLFNIRGETGDIYSKKCQANAHKQPFVMTPENYLRARNIYKGDVFWVEAPLSDNDLIAVTLANKTVDQRRPFARKAPLKLEDAAIKSMERRALEMGFPLKDDTSVTFDGVKGRIDATEEEKGMLRELIAAQKRKPLWSVLRAGSVLDRPNYYLCGVLWCVRDELPLIPEEYASPTLRNGEDKPSKTGGCPFCGGTIITSLRKPGLGETVYERKASGTGSAKVAQHVGLPKDLYHPDYLAVPCCFVDPDDLAIPTKARPLPPPHPDIPLPDIQVESPESAPSTASTEETHEAPPAPLIADENRERPFSELRLRGGAQNNWYVPAQNVVGRNAKEWYSLGRGEVGVPPPSVNAMLGQDPDAFLTANKGVLGVSINSYLKSPGTAFIRYGIGNAGLLGLLTFAEYATAGLTMDVNKIKIAEPEEYYARMFEAKANPIARAFLQANYGTLLHEFANPGREINDMEFVRWCEGMGIPLRATLRQRPYAEHFYKAWLTFTDYLMDSKQTKDLRLFEGLFATKGLLTSTGFILARIQLPKDPNGKATILCPEFGVSLYHQSHPPPILFVIQDTVTGAYDPLVLYDSTEKDSKVLLGVIQHETSLFSTLSASLREALSLFVSQYYGPFEGCGRISEPINPWMPERDTTGVPRLSAFKAKLDELDIRFEGFLRDRSNRLVGGLARLKRPAGSPVCFVPLLDDGIVLPYLSSLIGEEALPFPSLQKLLEFLIGGRDPPVPGKIAAADNFPGLRPVSIAHDGTNYISIDLQCGAVLPIDPFPITSEIPHRLFVSMLRDGKAIKKEIRGKAGEPRAAFPWETDTILLGPSPRDAASVETTKEEQLEEAYQHLRISFGHWLHSSAAGIETLRQIELLRKARRRLPLWDLRKRMDILVTSVLLNSENPWMSTEGTPTKSLLRRDCLKVDKGTEKGCVGGCVWAGREKGCLIHTPATERYVDPARVLSARLVDELLRTFGAAEEVMKQKVPFLRPLASDALIKGSSALLFAAEGRGSAALYDRLGYSGRQPSVYTKGYTYPEEVDMDVEGVDKFMPPIPEDWTRKLRPAVFGAEIAQDARARLEAALVSISKKSISELEAAMEGVPLDNSPVALDKLSGILNANILTTTYDPEARRADLDKWYGVGTEARFIVLDLAGVPLERVKRPGTFVMTDVKLPSAIRRWLKDHEPE